MPAFDHQKFVKDLPKTPGVYQMFDDQNEVIYVGKARALKNRVASYFTGKAKDNKTMALVAAIDHMAYHITRSEAEALLLENQLIKPQLQCLAQGREKLSLHLLFDP